MAILQLIGRPRHAALVHNICLGYCASMLWSNDPCRGTGFLLERRLRPKKIIVISSSALRFLGLAPHYVIEQNFQVCELSDNKMAAPLGSRVGQKMSSCSGYC